MRVTSWLRAGLIGVAGPAIVAVYPAEALTPNMKAVLNLPLPPKPLTRVDPTYPPDAEAAGVIGRVDGALTINDDGTVEDVRAYEAFPAGLGFGPATEAAVKQWRYPPHFAGRYRLRMKFRLEEDAAPVDPKTATPLSVDNRPGLHPPYPPLAEYMEVSGQATVVCWIDQNGTPSRIYIKNETPPDWGFAESAHNYLLAVTFKGQTPGPYTLTV